MSDRFLFESSGSSGNNCLSCGRRDGDCERIAIAEREIQRLIADSEDIQKKLDSILAEITKYRGFIGGITFIISGAVIAWQLLGEYVFKSQQ